MFGAQSIPQEPTVTLPSTPAKTAETPIPAKRTSKLIPVLIIAILLLLAAIAVVVVTMR
jgi:flagellar basal body-associated protein FliL